MKSLERLSDHDCEPKRSQIGAKPAGVTDNSRSHILTPGQ